MSEASNSPQQRAQWSSEPAFVFSMAAAAVGLGNLWRFPYMAGENGGAAFIIAYLIALAVLAVPLMMLEIGAGRMAQGSAVATFRTAHPRIGTAYGWLVVGLTVTITSYYLVITGWTLGYSVRAASFRLLEFSEFTAGYESLWYFLIVTAVALLLLIKGVTAIEKLSKLLMPVLISIVLILVVLASQTDGWTEAREFLFRIDSSRLLSGRLWFFAVGQAFYTLAIGQGYLITYGSYIPQKTHVPRAGLVVAGTETFIALLAGLMIFPFVFTFGHDPGEGSQLAFSIMPQVFESMNQGGILAIAFFFLFFAAAFSSSLAGLKVVIAAIEEEFSLSSGRAVAVVGVLMLLLGIPSALSFTSVELRVAGMPFLDFLDQFAGTNVVITSGVVGAGLFAWLVPRIRIHKSLATTSRRWEQVIIRIGRAAPFIGGLLLLWQLWIFFNG